MDNQPEESTSQPFFQLQRLYLKDISCKVPLAPGIYQEKEQPSAQFHLQIKQHSLQAHHYEIVLQLTAIGKVNERIAFNLDIQQAGVFKLEGFSEQQLESMLKAYCPSMLYPYLCRAVAETSLQAGFSPLLLTPINFDQLYLQQQANGAQAAAETSPQTLEPLGETTAVMRLNQPGLKNGREKNSG